MGCNSHERMAWWEADGGWRIQYLKDNWLTSTGTQIGEHLGISKSSVVGKANRLGLTPKKDPLPVKVARIHRIEFPSSGHCLWGIGHPTDETFYFCGNLVEEGQSYCPKHRALAYQKAAIQPKQEHERGHLRWPAG